MPLTLSITKDGLTLDANGLIETIPSTGQGEGFELNADRAAYLSTAVMRLAGHLSAEDAQPPEPQVFAVTRTPEPEKVPEPEHAEKTSRRSHHRATEKK